MENISDSNNFSVVNIENKLEKKSGDFQNLKKQYEKKGTTDKIEEHKNICEKLNKIYEKKNHDYGDSFGKTFDELGIISAVTRISDKYNRLVSLSKLPDEERRVKNETIEDTLLDMANYCIMTTMELRKKQIKSIKIW